MQSQIEIRVFSPNGCNPFKVRAGNHYAARFDHSHLHRIECAVRLIPVYADIIGVNNDDNSLFRIAKLLGERRPFCFFWIVSRKKAGPLAVGNATGEKRKKEKDHNYVGDGQRMFQLTHSWFFTPC